MKRLKTGLIGCKKTFSWKNIPGCVLKAVCDIDSEAIGFVKSKYKVQGFNDYREMIDKSDIDFVIIRTPDDLHLEHAKYALEKGKHVYCEKPMAINLGNAVELMRAAKKAKTKIQVGYELHISELYSRTKKAVQENWCGRILFAFHDYLRPPWEETEHFRMDKSRSGGLIVHDGCHYLDFLRWIIDKEVVELNCYAPPIMTKHYNGVLDNFRLNMRHQDGAVSGMTWSHMFGGHQIMEFCFIGTEGAIFCRRNRVGKEKDSETRKIQFIKHKVDETGKVYGQKLIREEDYSFRDWKELGHNIKGCIEDFAARLLDGEPPLIPIEESFISEYLCYAAEESAVKGEAVKIPSENEILSLI